MEIQQAAKMVSENPELRERMRADPEGTMATMAASPAPLATDVMIYRIVVSALGLAVLMAMAGALVLSVYDKPVPDVVTALGSAAIGALAGLLAPSPVR